MFDLTCYFAEKELSAIAKLAVQLYSFDRLLFFHCWRTAIYASNIGMELGVDPNILFIGGLLHDIGKLFVPYELLNKPGKFTKQEFNIVRQHPILGARYLIKSGIKSEEIYNIVKFHHKRFDGGGYPDNDIPNGNLPFIYIIGACDAFDAMTSYRPYSQVKSIEESLTELKMHSGTQFAPYVAESLSSLFMAAFKKETL